MSSQYTPFFIIPFSNGVCIHRSLVTTPNCWNIHPFVDDLISCNDDGKDDAVKQVLANRFEMKDLGEIHYCCGISTEKDEMKIAL